MPKTKTNVEYKASYIQEVVDKLGAAITARKAAEKEENKYKKTIKHICTVEGGTAHFTGKQYEVFVTLASRTTLPKDAVILHLGEAWVEKNSVECEYEKITAQPL